MKKIILSVLLVISLFLIAGCVKTTEIEDGTEVADDSALAGEAVKSSAAKKIPVPTPICPPTLKDYDVGAFVIGTDSNTAVFEVNGVTKNVALSGDRELVLPGGALFRLNSTLYQAYAGGLRGTNFVVDRACASTYSFAAYWVDLPFPEASTTKRVGSFTVHSANTRLTPVTFQEDFVLENGQSKTLRDGAKVIMKSSLEQNYAGGWHGVVFELICPSS